MITKSALVVAAAIAVATTASPVLAQTAEHTGGLMPNYYDVNGKQVWGAWAPTQTATNRSQQVAASNRKLYAFVGGAYAAPAATNNPALTGGGSIGYNSNLKNY
jgi:hypothetical protein